MGLIEDLNILRVPNSDTQTGNDDLPNVVEKVNEFIDAGKSVDLKVIDNSSYSWLTLLLTAGVGKKYDKHLVVAKRVQGYSVVHELEDFDAYILNLVNEYQAQNLEVEIFPLSFNSPCVLITAWETVIQE